MRVVCVAMSRIRCSMSAPMRRSQTALVAKSRTCAADASSREGTYLTSNSKPNPKSNPNSEMVTQTLILNSNPSPNPNAAVRSGTSVWTVRECRMVRMRSTSAASVAHATLRSGTPAPPSAATAFSTPVPLSLILILI